MILVVGATGFLGTEICRQLVTQAKPVRALVRSTTEQAKVEALRQLGIATVLGDLRDGASLEAACHGSTAVISTASAMPFASQPDNTLQTVDRDGQAALITAARAAGVGQFLYLSLSG